VVTFTVHEPPAPGTDRIDRGVELEFVRDGFSWLTAIFPPLGFIASGLWPMTALYLAGAALLGWALNELNVDPQWIGIIFLMLNIFLGYEASTLKRWMLEKKGWQMLGVVNGNSIAEAERRFFENWLPTQPIIAGRPTGPFGAGT
jgi:hypothetical protein